MAKKVQEMEKKMQDVIELATLGILFYCFVTRRYGIGLAVLTVLGITRLQSFEKEIPNLQFTFYPSPFLTSVDFSGFPSKSY